MKSVGEIFVDVRNFRRQGLDPWQVTERILEIGRGNGFSIITERSSGGGGQPITIELVFPNGEVILRRDRLASPPQIAELDLFSVRFQCSVSIQGAAIFCHRPLVCALHDWLPTLAEIHRGRLRLWSSQQHPAPATAILPPSRQETTAAALRHRDAHGLQPDRRLPGDRQRHRLREGLP
jgi:hypothetical protein